MTIQQLQILLPDVDVTAEVIARRITFDRAGNIATWTVPNVSQPSVDALRALGICAKLKADLLALFLTAPLAGQLIYSNVAAPDSPLAKLLGAGKFVDAVSALQGALNDDLIPVKYANVVNGAVALINAAAAQIAQQVQ